MCLPWLLKDLPSVDLLKVRSLLRLTEEQAHLAASHDVEVFSLLTLLEESVASDSVNSGEVPVDVLNLPICQSLKRGDPPDEGKLF